MTQSFPELCQLKTHCLCIDVHIFSWVDLISVGAQLEHNDTNNLNCSGTLGYFVFCFTNPVMKWCVVVVGYILELVETLCVVNNFCKHLLFSTAITDFSFVHSFIPFSIAWYLWHFVLKFVFCWFLLLPFCLPY